MRKLYVIIFLAICLVLASLTVACTSAPQPTPAPTPATSPTPTPPPTTSSQVTAGQLAEQGKTVFANCSGCHGQNGESIRAPAVIGPNAQMAKYNNAKQLLTFISTTMPKNAPGSLSQEQYLQLLSYLLVQNQFVTPETVINPNQLDSVQLK